MGRPTQSTNLDSRGLSETEAPAKTAYKGWTEVPHAYVADIQRCLHVDPPTTGVGT